MSADADTPASASESPRSTLGPEAQLDPSASLSSTPLPEAPQRVQFPVSQRAKTMADTTNSTTTADTKHDADPAADNNAVKVDTKPAVSVAESNARKTVCKKHTGKEKEPSSRDREPKKSRKAAKNSSIVTPSDDSSSDASSSSESTNTSGSSSEDDDDSSAVSESEIDRHSRRRVTRTKTKQSMKRNKKKTKLRSRYDDDTEKGSDTEETEQSDSFDEKQLRKFVSKLKAKKARMLNPVDDSSEDQQFDDGDTELIDMSLALAKEKLRSKEGTGKRTKLRGRRNLLGDALGDAQKNYSQKGLQKKLARKAGSKMAFKRVDQLWDNTIHKYKLTETVNDPDANEWDQYLFTVRRKFDWEGKYMETVVDLKSKHLREALGKVMDGVKGVSLVQDTAVVDPNMLFLYLEETRDYMKELKQLAKTEKKKKARKIASLKARQLKVLVKYLDTDYAETKKTLYPLLEANTITFDLLWALFKPNTIAYAPTYGNQDEPRAFKVEYAVKESSFMKGQWYSIEGRYLEYDGKTFGMGTMEAVVESFKGARKITSLGCYPLKYHRDADDVRTKLIERGKKFVSLKGMNYRFHKGMAFYKKKRTVIKVNINGRIMIDPAIHRRINPNYPISTVRPNDPDLLDGSDDETDGGCCCVSGSESNQSNTQHQDSDTPKTKLKFVRNKQGKPQLVRVEVDENGNEVEKEILDEVSDNSEREFTEEELLIASPVVLGFAFSEKLWLEFSVSGVSDIQWSEDAFDSLVLPGNQKSIVKALVESHTFCAAQNIDDVIQGKGRGLVAVLHGPPGTGKTLTAEGIAELLKRPLYMVSAGELGTDSRTLEGELNKILDIAHSWGAVLLLDEADIFLEKRTIQDIHRNALVSIFLRLLEYFQGILFLTTNRVETFDDAFQSRIHVALRYGDLTTKAKRSVWKMFLQRVQAVEGVQSADFTDKDFDMLSRHNLNGRQIKNSVRTAQALAVNEGNPLSMEHIKRVLEVAETFDHDLRGGSGYMDAMRSYT
ncbi:hypothetical protein AN6718.2 [Aspergillus nidulans FGSC A4]|nr:hypothetical protein AN6718.2 [Aspergillus nidulans FGSC A4]|eukprot:XP_664322.1 hypothetical protein AN6718.2 [Aspergillus nidulans FGSC A4]